MTIRRTIIRTIWPFGPTTRAPLVARTALSELAALRRGRRRRNTLISKQRAAFNESFALSSYHHLPYRVLYHCFHPRACRPNGSEQRHFWPALKGSKCSAIKAELLIIIVFQPKKFFSKKIRCHSLDRLESPISDLIVAIKSV